HRDDRRDRKKREIDAGALEDREIEERVRELDERIANRDRRTARATFPGENNEAENRNVVEPANRFQTVRTVTGRKDDRLFARVAVDDDIEETSDDRAGGECIKREDRLHRREGLYGRPAFLTEPS